MTQIPGTFTAIFENKTKAEYVLKFKDDFTHEQRKFIAESLYTIATGRIPGFILKPRLYYDFYEAIETAVQIGSAVVYGVGGYWRLAKNSKNKWTTLSIIYEEK